MAPNDACTTEPLDARGDTSYSPADLDEADDYLAFLWEQGLTDQEASTLIDEIIRVNQEGSK